MICSSRIILKALFADLIRPTFQVKYVHTTVVLTLCLGLPLLRHTISAASFLAYVQHRVSVYGLVVVGVWPVRRPGRAGIRIEQRRAT